MDFKSLMVSVEAIKAPEEYKEVVRRYVDTQIAKPSSLHTIRNKIFMCSQALKWSNGKGFDTFKDETVFVRYIASMRKRGLKESTISHETVLITYFLRWYFRDNTPAYLANVKVKKTRKELANADLLSPSEIKAMVSKADNPRDRALIMTLYDAGVRIGELLNVKVEDVEFKEQETIIRITKSKTKPRKVPLFDATPYLRNWLNNHPFKDNPDSPLFICRASNYYGQQLYQCTVGNLLRRCAKRAGIKKYVYPHLLRHSRISWWAKVERLNERDLRILAGWSETSDMPNTYIHYGLDGVLEKMKSHRGLLDTKQLEQEAEKKSLLPVICSRCNKSNEADSLFCNCGTPLSTNAYVKMGKIKQKEEALHQKIFKMNLNDVSVQETKDIKEAMYQMMKKDPLLIKKLKELVSLLDTSQS